MGGEKKRGSTSSEIFQINNVGGLSRRYLLQSQALSPTPYLRRTSNKVATYFEVFPNYMNTGVIFTLKIRTIGKRGPVSTPQQHPIIINK